jgi:hypothetical protein
MKTKHAAALTLLCGLAVVLTGCATILSGESQTVTIHSTPPGAYVKVGYQTGTTPVTFHVPKGQNYPVEIAHGPDKRLLPLHRTLDPMTLLNLIPPLWPGFIVDAATGAITKYNPDVIAIDFRTGHAAHHTHLTDFPY